MGTAIKNKDYVNLYSITSSEYQSNHSQQQMINGIQTFVYHYNDINNDIGSFDIGQIEITNRSKDNARVANGYMSFTFANRKIIAGIHPSLIAENGQWKIVDLAYHQS